MLLPLLLPTRPVCCHGCSKSLARHQHTCHGPTPHACSWANAYNRMLRQPYYPKLLVGVPFTPVPGPRLLVKPGPHAAAVRRALADSLKQVGGVWEGAPVQH